MAVRDVIEFDRKRLGCQRQLGDQHEHRVQFDRRRRHLHEFGNAVEAIHVQSIQYDEEIDVRARTHPSLRRGAKQDQ
jgi:hypothetical protein